MKPLIILMVLLSLYGCKESGDTDPDDLKRIQIDQIHDRCVSLEGEAGELDCLKEYAGELSEELSKHIGIKVYDSGQ
jgi:hypothetical protein